MKCKTKFFIFVLTSMLFTGCSSSVTVTEEYPVSSSAPYETPEPILYEAMLYYNQGNNFLTFEGRNFTISPNKAKQYGYNSAGSWDYWYETSSVVTVEIDGNYIQTCGSTVVFKDKRLEMHDIPNSLETANADSNGSYTVTTDGQPLDTYFGLRHWWYNTNERGQHGEKLVLIQSQDGYNIGAFIGSDVTWKVEEKLPKTTKLTIDSLPVFIHRCNFTIIDSNLMEQN